MKVVIGVTGKFGSGKSTVAKILEKKGAKVIKVDEIGHEVLENEEVKMELLKVFGEEIFENERVNRKMLGNIVFSSEERLRELEKILHPRMVEKVRKIIEKLDGVVVLEAAILKRMKLDSLCDHIITVVADEEKIFERMRKKGFSDDEIRKRLSFQEDVEPTGIILINNGSLEELEEKVNMVWSLMI